MPKVIKLYNILYNLKGIILKKLLVTLPLFSVALLNANLIEKHNDSLLIGIDSTLKSINVEVPEEPTSNFSFSVGNYIEDVEVVGEYLYVVTDRGLSIYNYSTEIPTLLGSFETEYAKKVVIKDDRAYIANYFDGLQIVDISDKSNPIIDTFFEKQTAVDLVVDGDYLYLLTKKYGLSVLDISERRATLLKEFKVEHFSSLVKDGDRLYISNEYKGVYILDVSSPPSPKFVSRTITKANRVVKNSDSIRVLNSRLGTVEKIDETSSTVVDYKEVPQILSFDSDGEYIYTLNLNGELAIIDGAGQTVFADGIPADALTQFPITLTAGWNLVGNPTSENFSTSLLGATAQNFVSYIDGVWIGKPSMIPSNIGFWIYSTDSADMSIQGTPSTPNLSTLPSGDWYLLSTGTELSPEDGTTYIYNGGQWTKNPEKVSPAQGFWFKR